MESRRDFEIKIKISHTKDGINTGNSLIIVFSSVRFVVRILFSPILNTLSFSVVQHYNSKITSATHNTQKLCMHTRGPSECEQEQEKKSYRAAAAKQQQLYDKKIPTSVPSVRHIVFSIKNLYNLFFSFLVSRFSHISITY